MKRTAIAALLAMGLGLAATGCGVQSTGVNVAQTEPFSVSGSSSSQQSSPSAEAFQITLYFIPVANGYGYLRAQIRPFGAKPGINDLVQALKDANDENLTTYVPEDLKLLPTGAAHQYIVSTAAKLNSQAQDQLACTFSNYWRRWPDKDSAPSVSFIFPGGAVTNWNDCAGMLGSPPVG